MPQELRIVKCFKCVTYQVDIVKKAKKWSCKMCGEKQTLKQEFGRGSGPECRKMVQQLNMKKHEFEQMAHVVVGKIVNEEIEMPEFLLEQSRPEDGIPPEPNQSNQPKSSKWDTFAEFSEEELDCENILEHKAQLNSSFKRRVYKRKSLCSPEITEAPEEPAPSQTKSSFFNFNKKSKFQFDSPNAASQDSVTKSKIYPKPKMLNPNSKWGNFLNNSDEEGGDRNTYMYIHF